MEATKEVFTAVEKERNQILKKEKLRKLTKISVPSWKQRLKQKSAEVVNYPMHGLCMYVFA